MILFFNNTVVEHSLTTAFNRQTDSATDKPFDRFATRPWLIARDSKKRTSENR